VPAESERDDERDGSANATARLLPPRTTDKRPHITKKRIKISTQPLE
jgi:hypothetical protein